MLLLLAVLLSFAASEVVTVTAAVCLPVVPSAKTSLTAARLVLRKEHAFMASSNVLCWDGLSPPLPE